MPRLALAKTRIYQLIIVFLSLIAGYLGFKQIRLNSIDPAATYTVGEVLDGDTFVLKDYSQRVRLLGVDAPELKYPSGDMAKEYLESLVLNKSVHFKNVIADRYGRILALVYTDNLLVNEVVIKKGLAEYDGHKLADGSTTLQEAEDKAKEKNLGIFGPESTQTENKKEPECLIKGNVRDNLKFYSFPGCSNYTRTIIELHKGDQWFCSEKEAKESGFTKALNCYGKKFVTN